MPGICEECNVKTLDATLCYQCDEGKRRAAGRKAWVTRRKNAAAKAALTRRKIALDRAVINELNGLYKRPLGTKRTGKPVVTAKQKRVPTTKGRALPGGIPAREALDAMRRRRGEFRVRRNLHIMEV